MTTQFNVAAVIPAFNERQSIIETVNRVKQYAHPLVIDDGSEDGTGDFAQSAGATVIRHDSNLGYDRALESGIFEAIRLNFVYAITIDADGQHNPELLKAFKTELFDGADVVVGKRNKFQRLSEFFFSVIGTYFWNIQDPLCGMKGYRLNKIENLGYFDTYGSIGTQYVIMCARAGFDVRNISIDTISRVGRSRFGDGFLPNYRIFRALIMGIIYAKFK